MEFDAMLKEKLENKIDKNLFYKYVDIQMLENEVTISGVVKNQYEKEKIESITRHTIGVVSINNKLAIN